MPSARVAIIEKSLADSFALSDRTFETDAVASWGSHVDLVAATLDGFVGDQPTGGTSGPGGGCDSKKDELWSRGHGHFIEVPSCVPDKNGNGPYRKSPVKYVPTIMDSMQAAGLTWNIYSPGPNKGGYGWAICPTFYECMGSDQANRVKRPGDFATDAGETPRWITRLGSCGGGKPELTGARTTRWLFFASGT